MFNQIRLFTRGFLGVFLGIALLIPLHICKVFQIAIANTEFCDITKRKKMLTALSTSLIYPGTTKIVFEQINGFENDVIYNKTIPSDGLYHFIKV